MSVRKSLTGWLRKAVNTTGIASRVIQRNSVNLVSSKDGGAVLMYHTVGEPYPDGSVLDEETFREHLRYLSNNYTFVDFRKLLDPEHDPEDTIALTFDGGYLDFYTTIRPLLQEFEAPAEVFVVPNRVGRVNGQPSNATKWVDWFDFMTDDQIRELIDEPLVTIGNKTHTHCDPLPALSNSKLKEEIVEGKRTLEERYGVKIDSFCYPRGEFDERALGRVSDNHDYAVATRPDFVNTNTDSYQIPRFTADWKTTAELREILTDGYVLEQNFRVLIR